MSDDPLSKRTDLNSLDEDAVVHLLKAGYLDPHRLIFSEIGFSEKISAAVQFGDWYRSNNEPTSQQRFQNALLRALDECMAQFIHNLAIPTNNTLLEQPPLANAIKELISIAAATRTTGVIPQIERLLKVSVLKRIQTHTYDDLIPYVLSVLGGFGALEHAITIMTLLFYNDFFNQHAAILFIALCKSQPENYPKLLSRFLDIIGTLPKGIINLDVVFGLFAYYVPPILFVNNLWKMREETLPSLFYHLIIVDYAPYKIDDSMTNYVFDGESVEPDKLYISVKRSDPTQPAPQAALLYNNEDRGTAKYLRAVERYSLLNGTVTSEDLAEVPEDIEDTDETPMRGY